MTTSSTFLVELGDGRLPATVEPLLVSCFVDDSLRLPDLFELRFRDPAQSVLAQTGCRIGSPVKISVLRAGGSAPVVLLQAEVTALEAEYDSGGTFTVVRGHDKGHRLFRGRRTASYAQVTAADVVRTVAGRAAVPVGRVDATSTVYDQLTQAATSDWHFLAGLAAREGYELAVRSGALDFGRAAAASDAPAASGAGTDPLVVQLGVDLIRFRSTVTAAEQVARVEVRGWDVATKKALVATAPAQTRSAVLDGATPAQLASAFGDPVLVATDVPYGTQAQVDAAAAALAEHVAGGFAEFEGVARGNPQIRADTAITVTGVGRPFAGTYTVTTSRHRFDPVTGYTTSFAVTGRQDRSLYGLVSGGAGATRSGGVVVGVVSDVRDPQGGARVRLTFPWLSEDYVSDWARTLQPGAGKGRGAVVLPEVGDEVLVAFEQGDPGRPYVLGGLYNGVDTPSDGGGSLLDPSSGAVNRRSVVSRRGHRLDLRDVAGGADGVQLATGDGALVITLDATKTQVTVTSDGTVLVSGSKGVTVDAGSSPLELKGSSVTLTAASGVTIDGGGGAVQVTAGGQLALKGASATLEGSARAEVKGGALCSVSATLVKIN